MAAAAAAPHCAHSHRQQENATTTASKVDWQEVTDCLTNSHSLTHSLTDDQSAGERSTGGEERLRERRMESVGVAVYSLCVCVLLQLQRMRELEDR